MSTTAPMRTMTMLTVVSVIVTSQRSGCRRRWPHVPIGIGAALPVCGGWSQSCPPNGGVEPPRGEAERSARTTCYTPMVANPSLACYQARLAEPLGKRDNDALRPADVG